MTITNAATDLTHGIPLAAWNGTNQAGRDLLVREHRRQLADAVRRREAEDAQRLESLRRYLAPPSPLTEPAAQLRRLLLDTADAARALAMTLPADSGPSPDADAS